MQVTWKPTIVAFCCNWCSYAGADLSGTNRLSYPANVKIIRIPCSCRLNPMFILRAFQRGADGVILCGCHPGDCHYTTGNYYARRRMTLLFSMLDFLGIERMLERVRLFAGKCRRARLTNARVLRLEALYTFHYLLPDHHARRVYVFFPDPWPKRKHHAHRLFGPLFLNALWKRLEIGGRLEFATDHAEYFAAVEACFAADGRFRRVEPMARPPEVWTEFETMFRAQGLEVHSAAWEALPGPDAPLEPLRIPPEAEPREGLVRRDAAPDTSL